MSSLLTLSMILTLGVCVLLIADSIHKLYKKRKEQEVEEET